MKNVIAILLILIGCSLPIGGIFFSRVIDASSNESAAIVFTVFIAMVVCFVFAAFLLKDDFTIKL